MANVIEIAKAAVTAYNEKDWNKTRDMLAADAVYDEKATNRRLEGAGQIIEAFQGWANAFPDSKATFIREFASGDTAVLELVWKGVHRAAADANRCHSGFEQADRSASLRSLPDRR
jgi:hypothetical protein